MAQITSAMAAKCLRKLNEEHDALLQKEKKSDTYTVSVQEKPEDVRPEYDYAAVQLQLRELEDKIRKVKYAINQFNLTQDIPEFNMTIDQMLIYIPQLTARKNKLNRMRSRLPKERVQGGMSRMSGIVEYEFCIGYQSGRRCDQGLVCTGRGNMPLLHALSKPERTVDVESVLCAPSACP